MADIDKDLEQSLNSFVDKWQKRFNEYFKAHYANLEAPKLTIQYGSKNAKIVRTDGQTSVAGFVDLATGDVLKASSWRAPAKHARGNIFSKDNGMEAIDNHCFVKYL